MSSFPSSHKMRALMTNALKVKKMKSLTRRSSTPDEAEEEQKADDPIKTLADLKLAKWKQTRDVLAMRATQRREDWLGDASNSKDFTNSKWTTSERIFCND